MILVGIDIGKLSHMFCVMDSSTGEFLVNPISFKNNKQGFDSFMDSINSFSKKDVLIGMEDTGHYHFNLLKFLLDSGYAVALINPITTDMTRKMQLGATKDDDLDARLICDVLASINAGKATGSLRSTALIFMSRNVLPASITTSRNS